MRGSHYRGTHDFPSRQGHPPFFVDSTAVILAFAIILPGTFADGHFSSNAFAHFLTALPVAVRRINPEKRTPPCIPNFTWGQPRPTFAR
jgi:hypothetical protein